MSVFRQHCPRERGDCSKSGLLQFLEETKPKEYKETLRCPHWMTFAHWLTRWTHGIQVPLAARHLKMNCAFHVGLLFHASISFDLERLGFGWETNLNAHVLIRIGLDPCLSSQLSFSTAVPWMLTNKLQKYLWLCHNFRFPHTLQTSSEM